MQGNVYDLGWAAGANPLEDPLLVIMVAFDKYQGPALTEEAEEFPAPVTCTDSSQVALVPSIVLPTSNRLLPYTCP